MNLNFGCGLDVREGFDNVDLKDFDFNVFPYPLKDDTYSYVVCDNVLEHLDDLDKVVSELYRISRDGAVLEFIVPFWHSSGAFNDYTHRHWFNKRTFELLFGENHSYRVEDKRFKIESVFLRPTRFGKLFPSFLRERASWIFGEVYDKITVKIKVIK